MNFCLVNWSLLFLLVMVSQVNAEVVITQDDNVADKIDAAVANEVVRFFPGTYEVNLELDARNLRFVGADTKNTILKSKNGTDPVITVGVSSNAVIQNFTFLESPIGIRVIDSTSGLKISNNVFRVGDDAVALDVGIAISTEITNNTFFDNGTILNNLSTSTVIKNNIFANYNNFLLGEPPSVLTFNCIGADDDNRNYDESNLVGVEATFVDSSVEVNDFHLKSDSNCINQGEFDNDFDKSRTDMGAYGGENYDMVPDSVPIIVSDASIVDAVVISWEKSNDYLVAGYKLYYSPDPIQSRAQDSFLSLSDRKALQSITLAETSRTIMNLFSESVRPQKPTAPVLQSADPGESKLTLSWSIVENATSYNVYYQSDSDEAVKRSVGNVSGFELDGLSDGVLYTVWIEAENQLSYYFQVAAYIENENDTEKFAESYFTRKDTKLDVGVAELSERSNTIAIRPEAVLAYPALSNEGCFIATAAYGFYSAQQVQVLRNFRDRYLLTNARGRSFVQWYYTYGPYAATIIRDYPWLKPIVRGLLYPLILIVEQLEKSTIAFVSLFSVYLALLIFMLKLVVPRKYTRKSYFLRRAHKKRFAMKKCESL